MRLEEASSKQEYIAAKRAEGWRVTDTKINETDFSALVTLSDGTADTLSEVIAIEPPSDSRVVIWEGARFWNYFGGTTEVGDISREAITLQRVDTTEEPIDSGIYSTFKQTDEEKVYRWPKRTMIVAGNKLRIKLNSSIATTASNTRFALDALILQKTG